MVKNRILIAPWPGRNFVVVETPTVRRRVWAIFARAHGSVRRRCDGITSWLRLRWGGVTKRFDTKKKKFESSKGVSKQQYRTDNERLSRRKETASGAITVYVRVSRLCILPKHAHIIIIIIRYHVYTDVCWARAAVRRHAYSHGRINLSPLQYCYYFSL